MKLAFRPIATVAVLAFSAWYVSTHLEAFALIADLDWRTTPILVGISMLSIMGNGLVLAGVVRAFGVRLGLAESFGISAIGGVGNYAPVPQAGPAARAVYLNRVHGLSVGAYAGTVVAVYVIALALQGVVGLIALGLRLGTLAPAPLELFGVFSICVAAGVLLSLPAGWLPEPLWLKPFRQGFLLLRRQHLMSRVALLQLLQIGVAATSLWLALAGIGREVEFVTCLLVANAVLCSAVFNVTPGNIGVAESAAWMSALLLGEDPDAIVVAFTVVRAVALVTLFTLGPLSTLLLGQRDSHD